jgi:AcrR family transcriptional regulator
MSRPQRISDSLILEAAREVFMAEGYGASTATIARRAGVSEGLLFRRWPTKEALFEAAMIHAMPAPRFLIIIDSLKGRPDTEQALIELCTAILEFFEGMVPVMNLAASNPTLERHNPTPIVEGMKRLSAFFEGEMRAGRMRRCDPEMVVRTLTSSMHGWVVMERNGVNQHLPVASSTHVRSVVDLVWNGLKP